MRQYVGARYVPILFNNNGSNNWVNGIGYEALTIVTYLNNSYTSIKNVPSNVGNPAQNPEYWVNTGNYNAMISEINQELSDINTSIAYLKNKQILLIGDSYSTGYGLTTDSYAEILKNFLNQNGIRLTISASAGTGFIGSKTTKYIDLLNQAQNLPYDIILVQGFLNDYEHSGGLKEGIQEAIAAFKTRASILYPTAKIYALPIGKRLSESHYEDMQSIINFLNQSRYIVVQDSWGWLFSPLLFQDDGTHPNNLGVTVLYNKFLDLLFNTNYQYRVDNTYWQCTLSNQLNYKIINLRSLIQNNISEGEIINNTRYNFTGFTEIKTNVSPSLQKTIVSAIGNDIVFVQFEFSTNKTVKIYCPSKNSTEVLNLNSLNQMFNEYFSLPLMQLVIG